MIIITGSLSFDPSDRDDVLASLAEVTEASRHDRRLPRVLLGRGSGSARHLSLLRVRGVQELLDAHLAQPHEIAFGERNLSRITGATAGFFDASPTAPTMPAAG